MQSLVIRRDVCPFEVSIEGGNEDEKNIIKDIYITELGLVMIAIYNEEKKITVNYVCSNLKDILPDKISLK